MRTQETAGAITPWPVGLFGSAMGLAGLSLAWRLAAQAALAPRWMGDALAVVAWAVFFLQSAVQLRRARYARETWLAELRHPATQPFAGTFWISVLLLPMLLPEAVASLARGMWLAGVAGMTVFAWWSLSRWLSGGQEEAHVSPAWLIPVVGLLDIPLAYPALGGSSLREAMVFATAAGLVLGLPLLALVFARLMLRPPSPQPALLILLAPFSVGFSAWVAVTGTVDTFARALFYLAVFLLAVLLPRVYAMVRERPFEFSWWALSFPLAATAVAAQRYAAAWPSTPGRIAAFSLLALSTLAIGALLGLSLRTIVRSRALRAVPAPP